MRRGEVTRAVSTEVDGGLFGDSFGDVDAVISQESKRAKSVPSWDSSSRCWRWLVVEERKGRNGRVTETGDAKVGCRTREVISRA